MGIREQTARTRAALLEAAAAEFARRGFEAARVQDIVDRAGITKGSLFRYFPTKEHLARHMIDSFAPRWSQILADAEGRGGRGLAGLRALSLSIAETLRKDDEARAVLRLTEEIQDAAYSALRGWHDAALRLLQQAIADAEIPDSIPTHQVSKLLVDSICGVCMSVAPWRDEDIVARVDELWQLIEPGLRGR